MTTTAPVAANASATFPEVSLSQREKVAFALYASGHTMGDVAEAMGVGETSVQTYIKRIRKKYLAVGVHLANKVDLYRAAQAAGLLEAPL